MDIPMTNLETTSPTSLAFHGATINLFERAGQIFVSIRSLCEFIPIDVRRPTRRVQSPQSGFSWGHMPSTGSDGKQYQMLCIPALQIDTFLATINLRKVSAEAAARIKMLRDELLAMIVHRPMAALEAQLAEARARALRLREHYLDRHPLSRKLLDLCAQGCDWVAITRLAHNTARWRLVNLLADLQALGFIEALPSGTPASPLPPARPAQLSLPEA